jgi:hypothetical protein
MDKSRDVRVDCFSQSLRENGMQNGVLSISPGVFGPVVGRFQELMTDKGYCYFCGEKLEFCDCEVKNEREK